MTEGNRRIWLDIWAPAHGQVFADTRALHERACELFNERLLLSEHWHPGATYKDLVAVAVAEDWLHGCAEGTMVLLPREVTLSKSPRSRPSSLTECPH